MIDRALETIRARAARVLAIDPADAPPHEPARAFIAHPETGHAVPASRTAAGAIVPEGHPDAVEPEVLDMGDPRHAHVDKTIQMLGESMVMGVREMEEAGVTDFAGVPQAVREAFEGAEVPPLPEGDHPFRDAGQHERYYRQRAAAAAFVEAAATLAGIV